MTKMFYTMIYQYLLFRGTEVQTFLGQYPFKSQHSMQPSWFLHAFQKCLINVRE